MVEVFMPYDVDDNELMTPEQWRAFKAALAEALRLRSSELVITISNGHVHLLKTTAIDKFPYEKERVT